jgi:hypothetical protein
LLNFNYLFFISLLFAMIFPPTHRQMRDVHGFTFSAGNPETQCPFGCGGMNPSPNNNMGADAMAGHIAHELAEMLSDPDGWSGWVDENNIEGAGAWIGWWMLKAVAHIPWCPFLLCLCTCGVYGMARCSWFRPLYVHS